MTTTRRKKKTAAARKPKLLSGGNPQIPKADGDAPVRRYVAAVPDVRKAVKWNSPFYGAGNEGWFLSFHCFNRYIKLTFFHGRSLNPAPPGEKL